MDHALKYYDLNDLMEWGIKLQFRPDFHSFITNQTVCMGFHKDSSPQWSSDFCETEYLVNANLIECSCKALDKNIPFSIITNSSRRAESDVEW